MARVRISDQPEQIQEALKRSGKAEWHIGTQSYLADQKDVDTIIAAFGLLSGIPTNRREQASTVWSVNKGVINPAVISQRSADPGLPGKGYARGFTDSKSCSTMASTSPSYTTELVSSQGYDQSSVRNRTYSGSCARIGNNVHSRRSSDPKMRWRRFSGLSLLLLFALAPIHAALPWGKTILLHRPPVESAVNHSVSASHKTSVIYHEKSVKTKRVHRLRTVHRYHRVHRAHGWFGV